MALCCRCGSSSIRIQGIGISPGQIGCSGERLDHAGAQFLLQHRQHRGADSDAGEPVGHIVGVVPDLDAPLLAGSPGHLATQSQQRSNDALARTIRRKLVLEISGLPPPVAIVPAQFEPTDCLMGEKSFFRWNR